MISHEAYSPSRVIPFSFEDPFHQAVAIREASEQRIGVADNGQLFSAICVNRAFSGNSAILRMNSLFGSTANFDQQYIATQYAAAFPDRPYMSIDLPAHGASDKLTDEQRKSIIKSDGSLELVADAQIEAALDLMPNLRDVTLTGEAMGELFAVEFAARAAAKGVRVRKLFGFDPIGMENRSPFALASQYLANAQKSRNQRRHDSEDEGEQRLRDAFEKEFVPQAESLGPVKTSTRTGHAGLMARERTVARLMLRKSPITNKTGMRALEAAMEAHPEVQTHMVFAGRSVIGRLNSTVASDLMKIKSYNGGGVHVDEWPDDNQDIGLAHNQPRLIKYVKDHS